MKTFVKTFEFTVEQLQDILKSHPEAEENIRLWEGQVKCNGCNWEVSRLFVRAESRDEAEELLVSGDAGLCGECFSELLVEIGG